MTFPSLKKIVRGRLDESKIRASQGLLSTSSVIRLILSRGAMTRDEIVDCLLDGHYMEIGLDYSTRESCRNSVKRIIERGKKDGIFSEDKVGRISSLGGGMVTITDIVYMAAFSAMLFVDYYLYTLLPFLEIAGLTSGRIALGISCFATLTVFAAALHEMLHVLKVNGKWESHLVVED